MAEPRDPDSQGAGLSAGTLVGEYQIQSLLGEGGMGTVYAAVHPVIGKKVAIKVLSAGVTQDRSAVERFVLEARSVNAIAHPNIVDIFSFGQLPDRRHYFVMERLEGETLRARIARQGSLTAVEALQPFRDVGRALAAAHRSQVIHRDLKPDNIMLCPDEQRGLSAKLLDFGVAKLLDTGAAMSIPKTRAGMVVGTPQYMAPEQCLGGAVDARSDLYSLGVVLFEALVGRLPFDGSTVVEIWQGHVGKPPPRLREVVPPGALCSIELESLVMQLLAKNPSNRLQSAAQFCEALDAVAPTLGAAPARKDRPPRLDAPLVPPRQSLMMTSPGGLAAPSQDELARLAAAFEARISDVVALDDASAPAAGGGPPAPAPGPPTLEPMVSPAAGASGAPPAEAARYEPPRAPEVSLELGVHDSRPRISRAAPRPAPRSLASPPEPRGSLWTWLVLLGLVLVGAAAFLLRRG